jgi:beta-lactamase regulating signal transducer with metallopeptidase domain
MNADIQWACNELIGALIEGGAQGALITGLIWGVLKLCPHANAATRHAAWFATLLVVALLPVAHFGRAVAEKLSSKEPRTNVAGSSLSQVPAARVERRALPITADSVGEFTVDAPALRAPEELPVETAIDPVELSPQSSLEIAVDSQANPTPAPRWTLPISPRFALTVAICWVILAAIRLGGIAGQLATLRKMKFRAIPARHAFVYAFARVVANMRISRRPRLLISDHAPAPMAVGFFEPAMLLPQSIAERSTSGQLEHLFRHELAHLARRDDWTNLIQQAIAAVFFFHPGVLFLSRRLTAEREIACDDHALAIGRAPREYALFLTEFASQMKGRDFTAAPAAWSSNSQLKERIGMILNGKRNASPRVSRAGAGAITATAIALAIAAAFATPRFVVAAESSASASPAKAPKAARAVSVDTSVEPAVEVAVDVAPVAPVAVNVAPIEVAVPALPAAPSAAPAGVTIASIAATPALPGQPRAMTVAPGRVKIAMTPQPDGDEPRPHPKHIERDGDVEKRLDRLEKMVEELMAREKRGPRGQDTFQFPQNNFNPNFNSDQFKMEIDRAQREAERARRDAERAMREQKIAMERMSQDKQRAEQQELSAKIAQDVATQQAGRESLKARRHALEAQRKAIEKELQALEKEMQKQDEMREKQHIEKDKRNKPDDAPEKPERPEKLEKKTRDRAGDSDDDNPKRP